MSVAPHSDVDLVFLDLQDAVKSLSESRASPKEIRRALSRYIELSQRLTATMRKDYSKRCKGKWEASSFVGWNPRTELLKYLRNQDQHGEQVFITVHDRHFYDVPDDVEIGGIPGRQFVVDGHWQMTDQTLDRQPEGLEVGLGGPGVPYESTEILKPTRTESSYVLFPRKPEDQSRFQAAAVSDVHEFARDTLATLTEYFEFYKAKVGA